MNYPCIISVSSVHRQCIISASSVHHQRIISASPVHHQRIISVTSAHHQCIIALCSLLSPVYCCLVLESLCFNDFLNVAYDFSVWVFSIFFFFKFSDFFSNFFLEGEFTGPKIFRPNALCSYQLQLERKVFEFKTLLRFQF